MCFNCQNFKGYPDYAVFGSHIVFSSYYFVHICNFEVHVHQGVKILILDSSKADKAKPYDSNILFSEFNYIINIGP